MRDFRCNLLIDDREQKVWEILKAEMSAVEGRKIAGTELLRRLVEPYIRSAAKRLGMPLHPPRPQKDAVIIGPTYVDQTYMDSEERPTG